jgi:hypothetical protein
MKVCFVRLVEYGSLAFDPSVGFEPRFLARTDPQFCKNSTSPQEPPEDERALQAARAKEKVPCRDGFHAADDPSGLKQSCTC